MDRAWLAERASSTTWTVPVTRAEIGELLRLFDARDVRIAELEAALDRGSDDAPRLAAEVRSALVLLSSRVDALSDHLDR